MRVVLLIVLKHLIDFLSVPRAFNFSVLPLSEGDLSNIGAPVATDCGILSINASATRA